jgi:hypothetical protein
MMEIRREMSRFGVQWPRLTQLGSGAALKRITIARVDFCSADLSAKARYALCANTKVRSRIMLPEPCRHWHEKYPQGVVVSHVSALAGLWATQDISSYASRKGFVIRCPLANIFAHSSVAQR